MVEVDPLIFGGLIVSIVVVAVGAGIAYGIMKRKVDDTAERLDKLLDRIIEAGMDSMGIKPKDYGGDKKNG